MEKVTVTEQPPPYSAAVPPGSQPQTHPQPPQGGAHPPPPPGYTPYGTTPIVTPTAPGYLPNYGATNIIIPPPIIAFEACPACGIGILEDNFTCLGIACAFLLFPFGVLCCHALKNRKCSKCGALFSKNRK